MYQVSVEAHFDAAHFLRGYGGKCENLHGHRYKVAVNLATERLNEIGLAYDFTELKRQLNEVLNQFDHKCLNEVEPFDKMNPSAENIAATVFRRLKPKLKDNPVVTSIQVWESPESCVTYFPGD